MVWAPAVFLLVALLIGCAMCLKHAMDVRRSADQSTRRGRLDLHRAARTCTACGYHYRIDTARCPECGEATGLPEG